MFNSVTSNRQMNKVKKFFPRVLLAVVIITAVFGPWGAERSYANFLDFFTNPESAFLAMTGSAVNFGLIIFSKAVSISSFFLDYVVKESVTNMEAYTSMAKEGWKVSRDIANLFFIFIILYIAIATILQLSTYGMKDLLVTVIIVALLVNFSLVFTNMIIDASNILASEFYDKVSNITWNQTDSSGNVTSTKSIGMSDAIVKGMKLQTIFDGIKVFEKNNRTYKKVEPEEKWGEHTDTTTGLSYCSTADAVKCPSDIGNKYCCTFVDEKKDIPALEVLTRIAIIGIGGIIFELVTAFVLFAAGILFTVRLVVLLILMVLAPLAFLAMALPALKTYAGQWWQKLFKQSFFAPAYLFMFYLAIKLVAEGNILGKTGASSESIAGSFVDPNASNVSIIFNFVIVIIFMLSCLMIANEMGAKGAGMVQGWGNKARGWATGKASKYSRRGAGAVAEGMLDEKSWINKKTGGWAGRIASFPIIGRGFAKVSSMKKSVDDKQRKEYEKQYDSYSDAGLAALMKDKTIISKTKKDALKNIMDKRAERDKKKKERKEDKARYEKLTKVNELTGKNEVESLEEKVAEDKPKEMDIQLKLSILKQELPSEENLKKQQQHVIELEQIKERREELKDMKEELKKLKDKFDLEDRFKEVEGKIGGGAEEKKKEEAKPKTK